MKRIITDQGWLFIPSPGVRKMNATDVLSRALNATMQYNQIDLRQISIACGLENPESILDLNQAVKDLREIQYQLRLEAQALNIHLPMNHVYEEGMYADQPERHERPKLERMVTGLRQATADMVDEIELVLKGMSNPGVVAAVL